MKTPAQKIKDTTQRFIEISDIFDNVVLMTSGNACLIIEVEATNFSLLSKEEQDIKIFSYSSLLNSLSFSIQIFIRSKKIDITSYLRLLDDQAANNQEPLIKNQIKHYRDFVQDLVKVNTVLDKKFYIVIPYSGLESGISGIRGNNFAATAKSNLSSKAESLHAQLKRMNLSAKTLQKEDLVKLFHEIYNESFEEISEVMQGNKFPMVKTNT